MLKLPIKVIKVKQPKLWMLELILTKSATLKLEMLVNPLLPMSKKITHPTRTLMPSPPPMAAASLTTHLLQVLNTLLQLRKCSWNLLCRINSLLKRERGLKIPWRTQVQSMFKPMKNPNPTSCQTAASQSTQTHTPFTRKCHLISKPPLLLLNTTRIKRKNISHTADTMIDTIDTTKDITDTTTTNTPKRKMWLNQLLLPMINSSQ